MSANQSNAGEMLIADVKLTGADWRLEAKLAVPSGLATMRELLPVIQSLADNVVNAGVQSAERKGLQISCKKGCGVCCRQLVPITEVEARRLRELIEEMPEPRRSTIRAKFAAARLQLQQAGLLEKLLHTAEWVEGEARSVGLAYFKQMIACPFLADESCSIYADRPISCREYLVTSPAENCARPSAEGINMVKLPFKVWTAMASVDQPRGSAQPAGWVPLILAPEWAEAHPDEPPPRPGPELLHDLFEHLTGKTLPQPSVSSAKP